MKKLPLLFFLPLLAALGCTSGRHGATFRYFEYAGADTTFAVHADATREFRNPVLSGFYPDPSVCRKDSDYYLATSSFAYYPGIPIFHSRNLVSWTQVGHALNRPSQLNLVGKRLSGGLYAPDITYNGHDSTFYLINTNVDGMGNFIVKTKDPKESSWSEPVPLPDVGGIDPSLFFDDDGKAYVVHNDTPPELPQWDGHRAIWLHELNAANAATVGKPALVVNGGVDTATHPVWIEAPHLYKINGYYYLMCAEGGTSINHSEVIFRANSVWGPYVPWERNPILTQRDLPANRPRPVTNAGHADLVQTPEGDWYAVFLACRPYSDNLFNTGRETFMLPVTWQDGYPVILPKGKTVPYVAALHRPLTQPATTTHQGNFAWRDDFGSSALAHEWIFIRTPQSKWWKTSSAGLTLYPNGQSIRELKNPAFIGRRQQHLNFEAATELRYHPSKAGNMAGLVCYQRETHHFIFGKTMNNDGKTYIALDRELRGTTRIAGVEVPPEAIGKPVYLKASGSGGSYSFYASYDGLTWNAVATNVDASFLSTEVAGGFTGVMVGMYVR
ncbi:MAG: glycoside hydrolase family 43 protein [Prevotellaceae bacterium]|jgi:alpha-N-arabinofuranosidase|nr:glycoside hydrolase family 43 protein [Prevotellaceae bacterium]